MALLGALGSVIALREFSIVLHGTMFTSSRRPITDSFSALRPGAGPGWHVAFGGSISSVSFNREQSPALLFSMPQTILEARPTVVWNGPPFGLSWLFPRGLSYPFPRHGAEPMAAQPVSAAQSDRLLRGRLPVSSQSRTRSLTSLTL